MGLPHDSAMLFLDIYSKTLKAESERDICITMLIAALFTIPKMWKQSRCPSTGVQIGKMLSICMMEYYSALKGKIILICYNVD